MTDSYWLKDEDKKTALSILCSDGILQMVAAAAEAKILFNNNKHSMNFIPLKNPQSIFLK